MNTKCIYILKKCTYIYEKPCKHIKTESVSSVEASYLVSYKIAKAMKPFVTEDFVKDCFQNRLYR